jgi:chemotaxis methyl-accepting protein methylase
MVEEPPSPRLATAEAKHYIERRRRLLASASFTMLLAVAANVLVHSAVSNTEQLKPTLPWLLSGAAVAVLSALTSTLTRVFRRPSQVSELADRLEQAYLGGLEASSLNPKQREYVA